MNSKTALSAAMAILLATGGLAYGQGRGNDNERGRGQDRRGNDARQNDRADQGRGRANDRVRQDMRDTPSSGEWRRGGRLPPEYRNRQYVVNDWRSHRLSAPPRGYHWVQHGNDYVLVAITTGIIAQLLMNHQ